MTTTTELENTLPLKASTPAHPQIGPKKGIECLVYSLVKLTLDGTNGLLAALHQDDIGPRACRLVKDFQPRSLREAYDHHSRVRDEDETIHPYFFIAVEKASSDSVLVVYLKAPGADGHHVVGVSRCAIGEADLVGANLDVGNIDWIEYKEAEEEKFGSESPYTNPRYFSKDPRVPREDDSTTSENCVYAWFSLVSRPLRFKSILEPGWTNLPEDRRRFGYPGNVHRYDDPWSEIRSLFPRMCQVNKAIHRGIILVAENEDVDVEKGMSIYRVLWDAEEELSKLPNNSGQSRQQEVRSIMPELEFMEWTRASVALERLDQIVSEEFKTSDIVFEI
ncbi:hypothetical protein D6D13_05017 [Aureobasidium pullulans]|uniref:Uncharacterized protein n=1 Tax=Aureobasidium pullulans TaxID=5580 RepID=A0A4S9CTY5_AURPU|nr:hypothetical protein D6D13_05017 [Aureobasidium pullulans]